MWLLEQNNNTKEKQDNFAQNDVRGFAISIGKSIFKTVMQNSVEHTGQLKNSLQ